MGNAPLRKKALKLKTQICTSLSKRYRKSGVRGSFHIEVRPSLVCRLGRREQGEGRASSEARYDAPDVAQPPSFLGATRALERPLSSFSGKT